MSDAVTQVQRFFAERGCAIEIISCATSVHTAQQAAAALGTSVQHIVKALLFEADGRPVLVLCGGDRRVDTVKLAAVCAAQQVRKANAALTKSATGYSIGGVPPVAHATALPIFMDAALLACDIVYAAAGTARTLFAMAPQALQAMSEAQIAVLGET
jgi:prolyl-tRNA editing enzyme YbaK/EbsC (Cys-tRNA(Pro) deacylase)